MSVCEIWKCRGAVMGAGTWDGIYIYICYTHMKQYDKPRPPVKAKALFREQFRDPKTGILEVPREA